MDIKIDEIYSLKGKGDLKFSIYEERITKEKFITENGERKKVPLEEKDQVVFSEMIASNLTIEECIRRLIALKIKQNKETVSLERFLEIYIEEKEKFENVINKVLKIKV